MTSIPNTNDRYAGSARAFLKKVEACEESSNYWRETLSFLQEGIYYFKDLTKRNGGMRSILPPDFEAVKEFIEDFNNFIYHLDRLNDCISIKNLIGKDHWKVLSLGIEEAKRHWTPRIEGRLSEYLQKKEQGKSAKEQLRFEAMDAIQEFSKALEKTFRELGKFRVG